MSGFGSQAFGTTPYGLGTPAAAPATGGTILRDDRTGQSTGSRQIDPYLRDYVLDSTNGRILGMSNVKQLVLLAVSTAKGSSAMRSLGQEISKIDRVTSNTARRIDATLRSAVQHIVASGLIEVVGTEVNIVRPGVVLCRLRWRDTSTGDEDLTEFRSG